MTGISPPQRKMVLLAAAVCTKQGKALLSRQFVEMTRPRVEGLLAAFPKLMSSGKQHTFVETESVRYVYQPLDRLYVLLITTKTSNILEDLETLRLFSRVVPEYCNDFDEEEVLEHSFELIFAFDEIVALGYRESVNLAQIRTFTEMISHDENVYEAMRKSQEKEAKEQMKRKAKEIQMAKKEMQRSGGGGGRYGGISGGIGGGMGSTSGGMGPPDTSYKPEPLSYKSSRSSSTKAMKLKKKGGDVDSFVDQIISEGGKVSSLRKDAPKAASAQSTPASQHGSVHMRVSEKLSAVAGRDGGLDNFEILGMIQLRITDQAFGCLRIAIDKDTEHGVQLQTHPNVDKQLFAQQSVIALKQEGKSFPLNSDVGVLKWRLQTTNEDLLPLKINCWPSEVGGGQVEVNIEYELQQEEMVLNDVFITIPLPGGVGAPVVGDCEGEYTHDPRKHLLQWHMPVIDSANPNGSMEFTIAGISDDFFPVKVSFVSNTTFCQIKPTQATTIPDGHEVKFTMDVSCVAESYEFK